MWPIDDAAMRIDVVHPDGVRDVLHLASLRELDALIGEHFRAGTWVDLHPHGDGLLLVHGERRKQPRRR